MPTTKAYLKVSKHPDPNKSNSFLASLYINILSEETQPARHLICLVDNNYGENQDRPIGVVNNIATQLVRDLEINKDSFNIVQFDAKASSVVPEKQVYAENSRVSFYSLGNATNLEVGLDSAHGQIDKENIDNTTIVLVLAGPITVGVRDPKALIAKLKAKLGGKTVRIVPIGIDNYPQEFMKQIAEQTYFRGLIHFNRQTSSKTIREQVKPYLLARSKPITAMVTIEGEPTQCEELGSIEFNCLCNTVFEFTSAKPLNEINLKGKVKIGEEEINLESSLQHEINYDPEIIAQYYTQQYLKIVDGYNSQIDKVTKLSDLLEQLNKLTLNQYQLINDIHDVIKQTITSIMSNNESAYKSITTSTYTHFIRAPGNRATVSGAADASSVTTSTSSSTRAALTALSGVSSNSALGVAHPVLSDVFSPGAIVTTAKTKSPLKPLDSDSEPDSSEYQPPQWLPPGDQAFNGDVRELNDLSNHQQGDSKNYWFTDQIMIEVLTSYHAKRGFKLFGYSSDESLALIDKFNKSGYTITDEIKREIDKYLADENNKGKRLYDILIEEKIVATKNLITQNDASNPNYIWLDKDVIYLIQQKYTLLRGNKFLGKSSDESLALLNVLKEPNNKEMSVIQREIENYLTNHQHDEKPKRLYNILIELRNKCLPDARANKANHVYCDL